jgi:hypothetical protein
MERSACSRYCYVAILDLQFAFIGMHRTYRQDPRDHDMTHFDCLRATRRQVLRGAGAAALAGVAGRMLTGTAFAKAPMSNTQAPAFYRVGAD